MESLATMVTTTTALAATTSVVVNAVPAAPATLNTTSLDMVWSPNGKGEHVGDPLEIHQI